jgi:hypothetical protein
MNKDLFQPLKLNKDVSFLNQLKGKQILDIGFLDSVREGGLTIDYSDQNKEKRMILGFNELGMWLHWNGEKGTLNQEDIIQTKLEKFLENFDWNFKTTTLKDSALKLTYCINGNVNLCLTIKELKVIGIKQPEIVSEFSKKEKDLEKIVGLLNIYTYGQP